MYRKLCITLMSVIICFVFSGCSKEEGYVLKGVLLKSSDQVSTYIIDEHGGPILMHNETDDETIFDDLQSGDIIEVESTNILETYPMQTTIYSCALVKQGDAKDIPIDTLNKMHEMGYAFDIDQ